MAEVQTALQQLQLIQTQILTHQQQLTQRLISLETKLSEIQTNANNHLSNLTHQFNSLRLTHTREKKQIELQRNGSDFDKSRQFNNQPERNPNFYKDQNN